MDESLAGLSKEKLQKVSTFRTTINYTLAQKSQQSLSLSEAVKFLQATKFDTHKAEEVFNNYQKYSEKYHLKNLHSHRHGLNAELRTKKLEILNGRDRDGAQLLLFTMSKHDVRQANIQTSMQLLFLVLDQISDGYETKNHGISLLVDLRDCSISSFDAPFLNNMFSVLQNGYPLYCNMVYIMEPPSWFKSHKEVLVLQKSSKTKCVSLSSLSTYIPHSSLPPSMTEPHKPSSTATENKPNPPIAPPRSTKPMLKQKSVPSDINSHTGSDDRTSASEQVMKGSVNKIKDMFQGSPQASPTRSQAMSPPFTGSQRPIPPTRTPKPSTNGTPPVVKAKPQISSVINPAHNGRGGDKPRVPILPMGNKPVPKSKPVHLTKSSEGLQTEKPGVSVLRDILQSSSQLPDKENGCGQQQEETNNDKPKPNKIKNLFGIKTKGNETHSVIGKSNVSGESVGDSPRKTFVPLVPIKVLNKVEVSEQAERKTSKDQPKDQPNIPHHRLLTDDLTTESPTKSNVTTRPGQVSPPLVTPSKGPTSDASGYEIVSFDSLSANSKPKAQPYKVTTIASLATSTSNATPTMSSGPIPEYSKPIPKSQRIHPSPVNNKPSLVASEHDHAAPIPSVEPLPMYSAPVPKSQRNTQDQQSPAAVPSSNGRPTSSRLPEYSEVIPKSQRMEKVVEEKPKARTCYENVFLKAGDPPSEDEGELLDTDTNQTSDEVIYENFGPDDGNKWMNVDDLEQYIEQKGIDGLSQEYYKIKNEPLCGTADVFRLPCNTKKNRYKDVVCYDKTRISLTPMPGVEGSDYIHANYVNGYQKTKAFILTQGPLKRTVNDFWRMLWEKEVFVIVMTTKCVEMGKLKCAQYWPDGEENGYYGDIVVSVECHYEEDSYDVRQLTVQYQDELRTIMHYQFKAWPDYGVPHTGMEVLELLYAAREMQERYREYVRDCEHFPVHGPPLVIHCSAGIGRSGTFCALDYCIDELRVKGRVNIQQTVRQLRLQRAFAIQTDEQYVFTYKTVLEYALYLKSVMDR